MLVTDRLDFPVGPGYAVGGSIVVSNEACWNVGLYAGRRGAGVEGVRSNLVRFPVRVVSDACVACLYS